LGDHHQGFEWPNVGQIDKFVDLFGEKWLIFQQELDIDDSDLCS